MAISGNGSVTGERAGEVDVVVVGAGAVGLALAIALAEAGFATVAVGPLPPPQPGRTVALLEGSVRLLESIGVFGQLLGKAAPLRTMRLVDATGSVFAAPPVSFEAAELGLPSFGSNVDNADLIAALAARADATAGLDRQPALWVASDAGRAAVTTRLADGTVLRSRLLVAADGARSGVRAAAGIATRDTHYGQVAITAHLAHPQPHQDISTEFHTRAGPCTLVPLPGTAAHPHRSSLVWVMEPAEAERRFALAPETFCRELDRQSRGLLGATSLLGSRGKFPIVRVAAERLVAPRLALVGEAAHALPPIGAQGLNLSLRDAATLVDVLADARAAGRDIGGPVALADYERVRRGDVALRAGAVDLLNRALLSRAPPVDALRGAGARLLAAIPPVRHALMRQGLRPAPETLPRLMRGDGPKAPAAASGNLARP